MKILQIKWDGIFYSAIDENGVIKIGGQDNIGCVDGLDLTEVFRVAAKSAEVLWMNPLPTDKWKG